MFDIKSALNFRLDSPTKEAADKIFSLLLELGGEIAPGEWLGSECSDSQWECRKGLLKISATQYGKHDGQEAIRWLTGLTRIQKLYNAGMMNNLLPNFVVESQNAADFILAQNTLMGIGYLWIHSREAEVSYDPHYPYIQVGYPIGTMCRRADRDGALPVTQERLNSMLEWLDAPEFDADGAFKAKGIFRLKRPGN